MDVPTMWHQIHFSCPNHTGIETTLFEILAHSGGEIVVKGFCEFCDKQNLESTHIFKADIQRIIVYCAAEDVKAETKKQKMLEGGTDGTVSRLPELTDFDKGFLAEAHVQRPEGDAA